MLNLPKHVYESWETTGFVHSWMADNGVNTRVLEQLKSRLKLDKIVLAKALDIGDELVLTESHEIGGHQYFIEKIAKVSELPLLAYRSTSHLFLTTCLLSTSSVLNPSTTIHSTKSIKYTNQPPTLDHSSNPLPRPHPQLLHQRHLPRRALITSPQSQSHPTAIHEIRTDAEV